MLFLTIAALAVFITVYSFYPRSAEPGEVSVTIRMGEYYFTPNEIHVRKNVKIHLIFLNDGAYPHNAYLSEKKTELVTILYPSNVTTVEVMFTETGVYNILCTIAYPAPVSHYELGMRAKLVVE
ncbi:MAG: cupredoxin domain-containing protein [Candidatus Caldarchaeum sp.]